MNLNREKGLFKSELHLQLQLNSQHRVWKEKDSAIKRKTLQHF